MFARTVRRSFAARSCYTSRHIVAPRQFQTSSRVLARKDTMDKDSLNPQPNEYAKSGSDDQASAISDTAFDPKKTSPEEQHDSAGAESDSKGSNPLNVSPANTEVSKPRGGQEGGHEGSSAESGQGNSDRARTSGSGGAPKSGGGKHGG
ncbi:hypothetical protein LTR36_006478 [Oleoguttula mirabilis]|uniref:Uncharacterized protein n=1 Tax=Oleoguttula mirabilis TaxID=1507867 RepID=A0AAV9JWL1_9PEZI|nr:hypothetical protein LTR36_006478 [Oleoguttula mirabilis]